MIRILSEYYPDHQYILYNPKPGKVDRLQTDGETVIERRPSGPFWRLFNALWRQGPLLKQAERDGIEIYHGLSGELPRGIKNAKLKSVVTIHDLIFVTHPHLYKAVDRKIYFNKFKYAANNADLVIAISAYTKDQIIKHLKTNPNKIKVVYQTCHSYFKSKRSSKLLESTKLKYNLPDKFIINVGTIEERKNLFSLIKAVKDSDYHIVAVGKKTNYFSDIKSFIDAHQMNERVHFIEDVLLEELAAIYQISNIMVYTSLVEGFGIPIIESLYTSTPIICHHEGVFPEAAGPGSRYVDMTDIGAIRYAIDEIWNDKVIQAEMIRDGLEYVTRFDDKVIADKVMTIYQELNNV